MAQGNAREMAAASTWSRRRCTSLSICTFCLRRGVQIHSKISTGLYELRIIVSPGTCES